MVFPSHFFRVHLGRAALATLGLFSLPVCRRSAWDAGARRYIGGTRLVFAGFSR